MEETPVALQGLKLVRHISTFQEIAVIGRNSEYKDDYKIDSAICEFKLNNYSYY